MSLPSRGTCGCPQQTQGWGRAGPGHGGGLPPWGCQRLLLCSVQWRLLTSGGQTGPSPGEQPPAAAREGPGRPRLRASQAETPGSASRGFVRWVSEVRTHPE